MTHPKRTRPWNAVGRLFRNSLLLLTLGAGTSQAQAPCNKPNFNFIPGTITAYVAPNACTPAVTFLPRLLDSTGVTFSHILLGATTKSGTGTGTGSNFSLGITHVSVTATNPCGSTTVTFDVDIKDTLKPVFNSVVNITVNSDSNSCGAIVPYNIPSATDNCPGCDFSLMQARGFVKVGDFGGHSYFRTPYPAPWNQTDSMARSVGGNLIAINSAAEDSFLSAVVPDTQRAWIGFTDKDTEGVWKWTNGDPVTYTNWCVSQPDNWRGNQNWAMIHSQGTFGPRGCWDDSHSPLAPGSTIPNSFIGIVEMPACGVTVVRTAGFAGGARFPIGTTIVTHEATDGSGNKATISFTVTVLDKRKPVFSAVQDIIGYAEAGRCGTNLTYVTPSATDSCSTCSFGVFQALGFSKLGEFNGHTYFLTPRRGSWTDVDSMATSISGYLIAINTASEDSFLATIVPDTMRAWIGFTDRAVEGTFRWSNGEPTTYTNWCTAQPDNWQGNQNYAMIHSQGTSGPRGCWDDAHSPIAPNSSIPNSFFGVVEMPTCGVRILRTGGLASGSFFPIGKTVITYQATDDSGNVATISFNVIVRDTLKPIFSAVKDITVDGDTNRCGKVVNYSIPRAVDPCSNCTISNFQAAGFVKLGEFNGHSYFRTPVIGSWNESDSMAHSISGHLIAINTAAEDSFLSTIVPDTMRAWIGFTDRDTEGVWKWENSDPVTYTNWCIQQPDNWLGNQNWAMIHSQGTVGTRGCWDDAHSPIAPNSTIPNRFHGIVEVDGCGLPIVRIAGLGSGAVFPVGKTVVTYKATDDSGNVSTISFTVTVKDKMPPVALCKNATLPLVGGSATLTPAMIDNGSFDLCTGIASRSVSRTAFTSADLGSPKTVTLTVVDSNGNSATCTALVSVAVPRSSAFGGSQSSSNQNGFGSAGPSGLAGSQFGAFESVKVYPNPTSKALFVEVPHTDDVATVTLQDIQGRVLEIVKLDKTSNRQVRFDLEARPRGVYVLEVSYEDQRFRSKIVRQ